MTIQEFENRINQVGRQISDTNNIILKVTGPIIGQIKSRAPRDTGALQNSIQMVIESPTEFYLEMLDYGFFQNYGVKASPDSSTSYNNIQVPVEDEVRFGLPPTSGSTYQFGTRKADKRPWGAFYSGLNAQNGFFSMAAIAREITEGLQNELNNTIQ